MRIPANKRSRFLADAIPGASGVAVAIILWPLSWEAAVHTTWGGGAVFSDFWLGAVSLISVAAAVITTAFGIFMGGSAIKTLME